MPIDLMLAHACRRSGSAAARRRAAVPRPPDAGLALAHVAAVCPLLDPATTMDRIESGLPLYDWYFARKWRRSLQRKLSKYPASR